MTAADLGERTGLTTAQERSRAETLTVLVVTCNHAATIARALRSVARQEGVRIDRLIVSDDASDDETAAIATAELRRLGLPGHVRRNATRLGITRHYEALFGALQTDLVAILEGDDFWIDREKLAGQVRLLHRYPDAAACAVSLVPHIEAHNCVTGRVFHPDRVQVLGTADLVLNSNTFGSFSCMMYRTDFLSTVPREFYGLTSYDWIINAVVSRQGPILHVDAPGTGYRVSGQGAWMGLQRANRDTILRDLIDTYVPHCDPYLAGLLRQRQHTLRLALTEPDQAAWPGFTTAFGTFTVGTGGSLYAPADSTCLMVGPETGLQEGGVSFRYALDPTAHQSNAAAVMYAGDGSDANQQAFIAYSAGDGSATLSMWTNVNGQWTESAISKVPGLHLEDTMELWVGQGGATLSVGGRLVLTVPPTDLLFPNSSLGIRWTGATVAPLRAP